MAFVCTLFSLMLASFPTSFGTCFYCVEEGGSGNATGGNSEIKSTLVDNDDSQSQYVPPVV